MNPFKSHLRAVLTIVLVLVAGAATAVAASPASWQFLHTSQLEVTSGTVFATGPSTLQTTSAEMRAVQRDHGHHAARARLDFQFIGDSAVTKPLGSGLVRRQIGLKLRAADPCNLLYVMWRAYPDRVIEISRKSNPGLHTSAECGNNGYSDLAIVPRPAGVHKHHVLEANTQLASDGSLVLTVSADGKLARKLTLPAGVAGGLNGPVGVRSDNGHYRFRLSIPR